MVTKNTTHFGPRKFATIQDAIDHVPNGATIVIQVQINKLFNADKNHISISDC